MGTVGSMQNNCRLEKRKMREEGVYMTRHRFTIAAMLSFLLVLTIAACSCGYDMVVDEEETSDSNELSFEDAQYYAAFTDYYDYACYVIEGDDEHYHHQQCSTVKSEEFRFLIYNMAEVLEQNLTPCPECWDRTPEEFLKEFYYSDIDANAYREAAVSIVSRCAVMNYADNRYYHRMRCDTMEGEDFFILNTEAAESEGYEPCPTCWGGENANAKIYIQNTYVY